MTKPFIATAYKSYGHKRTARTTGKSGYATAIRTDAANNTVLWLAWLYAPTLTAAVGFFVWNAWPSPMLNYVNGKIKK